MLLIPCLILIVWLILVFVDQLVWIFVTAFSVLMFVYFGIFRWLRSYLSLIYAVSYDDFSDDNFKKSISLTKNNVWTIFINILVLVIVFAIIWALFASILASIFPDNNNFSSIIYDIYQNRNNLWNIQNELNSLIQQMTPTTASMITWFIKNIINEAYSWIVYIIWLIFYFLLMKSMEQETDIKTE